MADQLLGQKQDIAKKSIWSFALGLALGLFLALAITGMWIFGVISSPSKSSSISELEVCLASNITQCHLTPIALDQYNLEPTSTNFELLQSTLFQEKSLKINRTIAFWTILIGLFTLTNAGLLFFTLKQMGDHRRDEIKRSNRANKAWLPFTATQLTNKIRSNIKILYDALEKCNTSSASQKYSHDPSTDLKSLNNLPKKAFKQLQSNIKTASPKVALNLARIFTHAQIVESRYNSLRNKDYADPLDHQIQNRIIDTLLLLDRIEALFSYGRGTSDKIEQPANASDAQYRADLLYSSQDIQDFQRRWNRAIDRYQNFHPDDDNS